VLAVVEQFPEAERGMVADILERFSAAVDRAVSDLSSQQR
jgi:hypothetical protein